MMRKIMSLISTMAVVCTVLFAGNAFASGDREGDLHKIRTFLADEQIALSLENKHQRNVGALMKKIETLSDRQVAKIANNTPDLLQFGGETTAQTTEEWWEFSKKVILGTVIVFVVSILLL